MISKIKAEIKNLDTSPETEKQEKEITEYFEETSTETKNKQEK